MLTPNPTNDRLRFILKTYGEKKPMVVVQMVAIIAATVGADHWYQDVLDAALEAKEQSFATDVQLFARLSVPFPPGSPLRLPSKEFATALVGMVGEMPQFQTRHPGDPVFPWIATQLAKIYPKIVDGDVERSAGSPLQTYADWIHALKRGGTILAQWYVAERPNLGEYDLTTAFDEAKEWSNESGPVPQGEVAAELSDGWTAQRLVTQEQLSAEGDKMQHCVSGYAQQVARNETTIYSLRDKKGYPHVTIEVKNDRVQQTRGKQNEKPAEKYQKYVDEFYAWLEENDISTERIPKELQPYADAIMEHGHDVEDEYLESYARDWSGLVRSAEACAEWLKMGLLYNDAELAGALENENVTPEEFGTFPYAIVRKIHENGGVPRELEAMVNVARMTNKLVELLPLRDPPLPPNAQTDLFEREPGVPARLPGQDPKGPVRITRQWDKNSTYLGYKSIAFDTWSDGYSDVEEEKTHWLYPAEEWLGKGFEWDEDKEMYVGPWFIHRFTPQQAEDWRSEAGIEDGNVAAELRNRRVTPKMVAEIEEAEGYPKDGAEWRRTNDHVWDLDAQGIIDVIDERGMRRNAGSKRTSRPRR